MQNRFQVIGVNDAASFCECCGKSGLQKVVWILDTETGEEKHFGTTCANAPAKGFNLKPEIKAANLQWNGRIQRAASKALQAYKAEGGEMEHGFDKRGPYSRPANQKRFDQLRSEFMK